MPKALKVEDYIGNVYGRLTVLREQVGSSSPRKVVCECACGQGVEFVTTLSGLKSGNPKSCGCRSLPVIGSEHINSTGNRYKVVAYEKVLNSKGTPFTKLVVEFLNTGYTATFSSKHIKDGSIKDIMQPSIAGVGFIGSLTVSSRCKTYQTWNDMIKRCYSPKSDNVAKRYKGCSVTEEWYNFSTFKVWYEEHYKEGYQIDKDLLCMGNKIYSPETCTMIPQELNGFLTGGLSSGAHYSKAKKVWVAQCQDGEKTATGNKKQTYLGSYKTEREAIDAYKVFKLSKLGKLKEDYGEELPSVIFENVEKFIKEL